MAHPWPTHGPSVARAETVVIQNDRWTAGPWQVLLSTLVGLVVADATGVDLSSDPAHQPLHPGTLAAHPDLADVLLEWRNL